MSLGASWLVPKTGTTPEGETVRGRGGSAARAASEGASRGEEVRRIP